MTMTAGSLTADRYVEFFDKLASTPQVLLHDVTATLRIDIDENGQSQRWHLTIDHGRISVTQRNAPADAMLRTEPMVFDRLITGEANPLTAALRGRLNITGDARLLVTFKRLLPGPPDRTTTLPESAPVNGSVSREATA
jgi:putative sterol carrier protein